MEKPNQYEREIYRDSGKLPAVKAYRGRVNCDLFTAKTAIEEAGPAPPPEIDGHRNFNQFDLVHYLGKRVIVTVTIDGQTKEWTGEFIEMRSKPYWSILLTTVFLRMDEINAIRVQAE